MNDHALEGAALRRYAAFDSEQHIFNDARTGLAARVHQRRISIEGALWFSQPPVRLFFVTEDLVRQHRYSRKPERSIVFLDRERLFLGLATRHATSRYFPFGHLALSTAKFSVQSGIYGGIVDA
jgi:hypothetical protein